jgi:hypothetical protein
MGNKEIITGILIFLIISLIVYIIVIYECYKRQIFIFTPYQPPPAPSNAIYMGTITQLTPDEIQTRNDAIEQALQAQ